ncbi:MAG: DinB family protein [Candidatus Sulfotelmatobacter sp.]
MDLLEHLRRQFEYDSWANAEVLSTLMAGDSGASPTRPLQLLAHILSAERLWLERLKQRAQSFPVWPDFKSDQCRAQMEKLSELWREYFDQLSPSALSQKIEYKNSKGEPWASTVQDVLTHVVMHSAYHRGQIATLMRAAGRTPASTDYIHAVRQGFID